MLDNKRNAYLQRIFELLTKLSINISGGNLSSITAESVDGTTIPATQIKGIRVGTSTTPDPKIVLVGTDQYLELFNPYLSPTFGTFSIDSGTSLEIGQPLSGLRLFTWTTTNSGNIQANSISILDVTQALTLESSLANDGSQSVPLSIVYNTVSSHIFRITGINSISGTFQRDLTVNWRTRLFYGNNGLLSLTEPDVESLSTNALVSGFAGTYSFAAGGYKWFCYNSSLGLATQFKDAVTNLNVAMNPHIVVNVTNAYGITQSYNCHRTLNSLGSAITIQIS